MHHNRQRISLHDLTALRVDVNGERIMSLRHRSKKQVLSVGADVRGNVVALRPFVKLRKHQLELSEDQATLPGMVAPDGERKGKRLKKYHDYPVLLPFLHLPTSSGQFNETQNATDILPSSDLLKVIHYFASCYYDERGMMAASARAARAKQRSKGAKLPRKRLLTDEVGEEDQGDDWEDDEEMTDSGTGEILSTKQRSSSGRSRRKSALNTKRSAATQRTKLNNAAFSLENRIKNMHRTLDGSVLLLIGMLLQLHLELRIGRPPPSSSSWEDQVRKDKDRIQMLSLRGRKRTRPMRVLEEEGGTETTHPINGGNAKDSESAPETVTKDI